MSSNESESIYSHRSIHSVRLGDGVDQITDDISVTDDQVRLNTSIVHRESVTMNAIGSDRYQIIIGDGPVEDEMSIMVIDYSSNESSSMTIHRSTLVDLAQLIVQRYM